MIRLSTDWKWYKVIQSDTKWYKVIQSDTKWYKVFFESNLIKVQSLTNSALMIIINYFIL